MNETEVKYLAGLLDADGSMSFSFKRTDNNNGRYYVGLQISLCASDAIDRKGFVSGLSDAHCIGTVHRDGRFRQNAVWIVSKRAHVEMLVPRLTKHMVIKARHWDWMLHRWRDIRAGGSSVSEAERAMISDSARAGRRDNVGPLKPKKHVTWAWLAGYLDGDGWFIHRCYKNKRYGHDEWAMKMGAVAHENDACGLELIQHSIGGRIKPHTQSDSLRVWELGLGPRNRSRALSLLPNIAKHSQLKREKIDGIIHHHRQRLSVPASKRTYCKVADCNRPSHGHRLCAKHYMRVRRKGEAIV